VSQDTQKERFLDRINDPAKNWKFSSADITERGKWKQYMSAYEEAITETSTDESPWYIIPADKKWYARLAISQILEQKFAELNLRFPKLPKDEIAKLEEYKNQLFAEV
jgi:polyphosphate kinase 2 (PPK2 family)